MFAGRAQPIGAAASVAGVLLGAAAQHRNGDAACAALALMVSGPKSPEDAAAVFGATTALGWVVVGDAVKGAIDRAGTGTLGPAVLLATKLLNASADGPAYSAGASRSANEVSTSGGAAVPFAAASAAAALVGRLAIRVLSACPPAPAWNSPSSPDPSAVAAAVHLIFGHPSGAPLRGDFAAAAAKGLGGSRILALLQALPLPLSAQAREVATLAEALFRQAFPPRAVTGANAGVVLEAGDALILLLSAGPLGAA